MNGEFSGEAPEIRGVKLSAIKPGAVLFLLIHGQMQKIELIDDDELEVADAEHSKYTYTHIKEMLLNMPEEESKLNLLNNGISEI
jgi:hypothetical protein